MIIWTVEADDGTNLSVLVYKDGSIAFFREKLCFVTQIVQKCKSARC